MHGWGQSDDDRQPPRLVSDAAQRCGDRGDGSGCSEVDDGKPDQQGDIRRLVQEVREEWMEDPSRRYESR